MKCFMFTRYRLSGFVQDGVPAKVVNLVPDPNVRVAVPVQDSGTVVDSYFPPALMPFRIPDLPLQSYTAMFPVKPDVLVDDSDYGQIHRSTSSARAK